MHSEWLRLFISVNCEVGVVSGVGWWPVPPVMSDQDVEEFSRTVLRAMEGWLRHWAGDATETWVWRYRIEQVQPHALLAIALLRRYQSQPAGSPSQIYPGPGSHPLPGRMTHGQG